MTPKTGELHSLGVNAYLDDNYIHLHGRRTINEVNLLWRECRLTTAFASAFVVNAGRFHASRKLLRVPCWDGAPADGGSTRPAQPQLSDRGRRSHACMCNPVP